MLKNSGFDNTSSSDPKPYEYEHYEEGTHCIVFVYGEVW